MKRRPGLRNRLETVAVLFVLVCATHALAQIGTDTTRNIDRSQAIDQSESRTEPEAGALVSLSADKIISLSSR